MQLAMLIDQGFLKIIFCQLTKRLLLNDLFTILKYLCKCVYWTLEIGPTHKNFEHSFNILEIDDIPSDFSKCNFS